MTHPGQGLSGTGAYSFTDNVLDPRKSMFLQQEIGKVHSKFSLRKPSLPDDDICYIVPGKTETLHNCNFNSTTKTFLVIHGWTVISLKVRLELNICLNSSSFNACAVSNLLGERAI